MPAHPSARRGRALAGLPAASQPGECSRLGLAVLPPVRVFLSHSCWDSAQLGGEFSQRLRLLPPPLISRLTTAAAVMMCHKVASRAGCFFPPSPSTPRQQPRRGECFPLQVEVFYMSGEDSVSQRPPQRSADTSVYNFQQSLVFPSLSERK